MDTTIAWKQDTISAGTWISISSNTVTNTLPFNPWWTATTGYVVTKTADGYEWEAPSGWWYPQYILWPHSWCCKWGCIVFWPYQNNTGWAICIWWYANICWDWNTWMRAALVDNDNLWRWYMPSCVQPALTSCQKWTWDFELCPLSLNNWCCAYIVFMCWWWWMTNQIVWARAFIKN